jgi:competence protein ComEC
VSKDVYQLGDQLKVEATVNVYRKQTIPFGFNAKNYYQSKGILGYLDDDQIEYLNHTFHIGSLRSKLSDDMNRFSSSEFMKTMILGEDELNKEGEQLFRDLGIIHLLSISGLHLYGIVLLIEKLLFYLSISKQKQKIIILCIYIVFFYLNAFSMATIRLLLMYLFLWINEAHKLRFSKLDVIQFVFIIMLIFKIEFIYHLGFLITYLILNFLYLTRDLYSKQNGYMRRLSITIIIFLIVLPFNLTVSPLMIILLPLIMLIFIYPLFLGLILTLFIPELDLILFQGISLLIEGLEIIRDKNVTFYLPALTPFMILSYFLCLIYMFRSREKHFYLIRTLTLIFLFFLTQVRFLQQEEVRIYFLDVGQGDSIYIESNHCKIMVDAYKNSATFLKNMGVYSLDYLILTHSDQDHIKEAELMINQMNVKALYVSAFDQAYPTFSTISKKVRKGDQVSCSDIQLEFLSPFKSTESANNASIVFKLKTYGKTILFTGDIEKEVENELVFFYKEYLKSDFLKIAHHGSSTSSSESFLDYVSPKAAIISVGADNRYGFPSLEIIQRLDQRSIETYQTDRVGTIVLTLSEKKEKWAFYLPF